MTGRTAHRRSGLTLVEATIAVVIVGVMLVAALSTLAGSRRGRQTIGGRSRGCHLAEQLMEEILPLPYADPVYKSGMGPGSDEQTGTRDVFDDVDDYAGWSASPPQTPDGTALTGFEGWTRSVEVQWVQPDDPTRVSDTETGVKAITVRVLHQQMPVAELTAIRTDWDQQ